MSKKEVYEQKAEALLLPIIEANNFELVDVEYVKEGSNWYLRAYIDKEGGISVDDCEVVSRAFSDKLDEEDFIDDAYIMEVSSPGLGRPLKKEKDYKRSMGKELEIRTQHLDDAALKLCFACQCFFKELHKLSFLSLYDKNCLIFSGRLPYYYINIFLISQGAGGILLHKSRECGTFYQNQKISRGGAACYIPFLKGT